MLDYESRFYYMKNYKLTPNFVLSVHYLSATPIVGSWRAEQYWREKH